MIAKQLRYAELKALGIAANRPSLQNLISNEGFPPGRRLGANTRVWDSGEVEAWLAARPSNPKPLLTGAARRHRERGAAKAEVAVA